MFFPTAQEIWKNLAQAYSKKQNLLACYALENKIFNSKQGNLSVSEYYGTLNGLLMELDQYRNLKMKCDDDSTTLIQFIDKSRIFKFLSGFNSEFDPIRIQILGKEKLPSLSEVFFIVSDEEGQRTAMMEDKSVDGSALKGSTFSECPKGSTSSERPNRDDRWCTHCKRSGHTKKNCFKLHGRDKVLGRMSRSKDGAQRRASHTTSDMEAEGEDPPTEDVSSLSKAELECWRAFLGSLSKPFGNCSLSMTGKNYTFLSLNALCTEESWIIDSGGIDYMTPHLSHLSSYSTLPENHHITVANGSHIPVTGCGNSHLSSSLHLKCVLYVPKLSNNLLSIHKLTKDLKCAVTFFESHSVFQDLATGRTIGIVKEQDGLYSLPHKENKCHQASSAAWSTSKIWLQHKHLGHHSFSVLRTMFPHLFSSVC